MSTANYTDYTPGCCYCGPLMQHDVYLQSIENDLGCWHLELLVDQSLVQVETDDLDYWLGDTTSDMEELFHGLRIGEIVRRGNGRLRWRVTGLSSGSLPMVSLTSIPEVGAPSYHVAVGDDIAKLVKLEEVQR